MIGEQNWVTEAIPDRCGLSMEGKPRPNHAIVIEAHGRMTAQQKLAIACDLSNATKELFRQALRSRFLDLSEEEFHRLYLERIALGYHRNEMMEASHQNPGRSGDRRYAHRVRDRNREPTLRQ